MSEPAGIRMSTMDETSFEERIIQLEQELEKNDEHDVQIAEDIKVLKERILQLEKELKKNDENDDQNGKDIEVLEERIVKLQKELEKNDENDDQNSKDIKVLEGRIIQLEKELKKNDDNDVQNEKDIQKLFVDYKEFKSTTKEKDSEIEILKNNCEDFNEVIKSLELQIKQFNQPSDITKNGEIGNSHMKKKMQEIMEIIDNQNSEISKLRKKKSVNWVFYCGMILLNLLVFYFLFSKFS